MRNLIRLTLCALASLNSAQLCAQLLDLSRGHLKGQYLVNSYPDDSLLRDALGTPTQDANADMRLLFGGGTGNWSWQGDYQLTLRSGDTLELGNALPINPLTPGSTNQDDRRLMDLTHVITENDERLLSHRLDRLHLSYTSNKVVLRAGRQAVSWGNGLLYNPVDFFNPFDPAAVDKEYKTGDDMLYGQYLQDNGNDWQFVSVWRRDENDHTDNKVNTNAIKYHGFINDDEIDILLARHYEDTIVTLGGISSWGGAIVRGDLVYTHTDFDDYLSGVINISYSWVWAEKNVSGVLEYFHNDLGLRESQYDEINSKHDLTDRLGRSELYTLGKDYLAGGLTIEVTPLLVISPNVFWNLGDNSGLVQVVAQYDLKQNWQALLALNLPAGSAGSEYGGLELPGQSQRLSTGPGLFAQLAFYF